MTPGAPRIAYLQLAASMALVGANVAVAKLLAEALPIPMIAFLRCVLAMAVLWPLARWMDGAVRVPRDAAPPDWWAAERPPANAVSCTTFFQTTMSCKGLVGGGTAAG